MRISEFKPKQKPHPQRPVIELSESTTLADLRVLIRAAVQDSNTYKVWQFLDPFLQQTFATMHAFHIWLLCQDRPDGCDLRGLSFRYMKTQTLLGEDFAHDHIGSNPLCGHCLMFTDYQDDWEVSIYANKFVRRGKDEFRNLTPFISWTVLHWLHHRTYNTLWVLKEKHNIEWRPQSFIQHAFDVFQSGQKLEYKPVMAPTFTLA